jgi:hypothetical protein
VDLRKIYDQTSVFFASGTIGRSSRALGISKFHLLDTLPFSQLEKSEGLIGKLLNWTSNLMNRAGP